jgi:T5SS/PEP-CTERM-associated repeat protein
LIGVFGAVATFGSAWADTVYDDGANHSYTGGGTFDLRPGTLIVGSTVSGTSLDILASTDVLSDNGILGQFASSSSNSVTVTAGSTWSNTATGVNFDIGRAGSGNTLTISAGASVSNAGDGRIGGFSNNNLVTVTGAGSNWTNSGALYMADLAAPETSSTFPAPPPPQPCSRTSATARAATR